jgi:hypothetical protein
MRSEVPTEPGYYWLQQEEDSEPEIVKISRDERIIPGHGLLLEQYGTRLLVSLKLIPAHLPRARWKGPLRPGM